MITIVAWFSKHIGAIKLCGAAIGAALICVGFMQYRSSLIEKGYKSAESHYAAEVAAANEQAVKDQARLDQTVIALNGLASSRQQEINLKLQPMTERIEREVASSPIYSDCNVGDGVLRDLETGRATVNTSIAASAPDTSGR